ncbi:MAG: ATP-binding cassette domain-containing protein [Candidatus Marinimicrobia bacterium]|nr:ATP-binding cassette domain-containing protein [Candidatus Neomarinimicrobiota bacterium]
MTQPLYKIQNLKYEKGKRQVLSIGSFEIHRGIIYAITGPSGSGKSTLLDVLAGKVKIPAGVVTFEEDDITSSAVRKIFRSEMFYLPQSSLGGRGGVRRHMLKHIKTADWSNETAENRLENVVRQMNLAEKLPRKLNTLSPGEKWWIDLAICVASDVRVLIIDELEQHLGYDELENVKRLLQRKCNFEGTTIIIGTLSPMTIRKMTGVSVAIDHGKIAMIRSVREGGRTRASNDRGRGGSRGSERPRGGGRGRRDFADKQGGAPRGSSGGASRSGGSTRNGGGDAPSSPPRQGRSPERADTRPDRGRREKVNPEKSKQPAAKRDRPEKAASEESPKPTAGRGRAPRSPRRPQKAAGRDEAVRAGDTPSSRSPVKREPKEVDGNVKIEPKPDNAPPPEVDGNRKTGDKSTAGSEAAKQPARRVGRGRGTPRAAKKTGEASDASRPPEPEATD